MRHAHQALRLHTSRRRSAASHIVTGLLEHEQIKTTLANAKAAMRLTDKMITLAKYGTLAHRRQAASFLGDASVIKKLFGELGKRYASRQGGYTRLMRDFNRKGDGAPMAILELVDRVAKPVATEKPQPKGQKKAPLKAPAKKAEAQAAAAK